MFARKNPKHESWFLNTVPGALALGIIGSAIWEKILLPLLNLFYNKFCLCITQMHSRIPNNAVDNMLNISLAKTSFIKILLSAYIVALHLFFIRYNFHPKYLKIIYPKTFLPNKNAKNSFIANPLFSFVLLFFSILVFEISFFLSFRFIT